MYQFTALVFRWRLMFGASDNNRYYLFSRVETPFYSYYLTNKWIWNQVLYHSWSSILWLDVLPWEPIAKTHWHKEILVMWFPQPNNSDMPISLRILHREMRHWNHNLTRQVNNILYFMNLHKAIRTWIFGIGIGMEWSFDSRNIRPMSSHTTYRIMMT